MTAIRRDYDVASLEALFDKCFYDTEKSAIKSFAESGGTILIDIAGGNRRKYGGVKPFTRSIRDTLKETFPGRHNRPRHMAFSSPLYKLEGYQIDAIKFRPHTHLSIKDKHPQVKAIMVGGRPAILFSELDLTAGLVGYPSLVVDGYTPDSAFEIVRNAILDTNKKQ
jgi:hypothetical protein